MDPCPFHPWKLEAEVSCEPNTSVKVHPYIGGSREHRRPSSQQFVEHWLCACANLQPNPPFRQGERGPEGSSFKGEKLGQGLKGMRGPTSGGEQGKRLAEGPQ